MRRGEADFLIVDGMHKTQALSMQRGTLEIWVWFRAIQCVPNEWMTHFRTVHPYLVRAPGLGACLQQGMVEKALHYAQIGLGGFAAHTICNGAVLASHIGVESVLRQILIPFGFTLHHGVIDLFNFVALELCVQVAVRFRRAGKDHHTGRALVKPVHGPQLFTAKLLFEHLLQVRLFFIPTAGNDCQRRGFVHNQNVGVFVDDFDHKTY